MPTYSSTLSSMSLLGKRGEGGGGRGGKVNQDRTWLHNYYTPVFFCHQLALSIDFLTISLISRERKAIIPTIHDFPCSHFPWMRDVLDNCPVWSARGAVHLVACAGKVRRGQRNEDLAWLGLAWLSQTRLRLGTIKP